MKLLKLLTPRDKYAIRVLDDKNKEIMLIGIGNPFYIHADHIGYEDRYVFGGYIETELNLPLSLDTKAAKIILLSQDEFGLKEIKKIRLKLSSIYKQIVFTSLESTLLVILPIQWY